MLGQTIWNWQYFTIFNFKDGNVIWFSLIDLLCIQGKEEIYIEYNVHIKHCPLI